MSHAFSAEEIAAEERRPKRRVAALIGYAGTGYHGLQINHEHRTIEGDLFKAFVEAGAISKANADDPLKSKLVRCARTDRGVHAAGNVLSLNMIIEDDDVVKKINDKLPAQIRLWGVERTNKKFNCHVACDSRWYEYLLPSYALLPPHPYSFLAKRIAEGAAEKGVKEEWNERLGDVRDFWSAVDEEIKPILEKLSPDIRQAVLVILHAEASTQTMVQDTEEDAEDSSMPEGGAEASVVDTKPTEAAAQPVAADPEVSPEAASASGQADESKHPQREPDPSGVALRDIKQVWMRAKKAYRISSSRIAQLQRTLDHFVGTHNFHNYTIQKSFHDASAKRHIKSFVVDPTPIIKNDTEWLSLKVHGQSFMMHQIRKMVAMAALVVRTGAPGSLVEESYGRRRISIPKAPGLGLLLERPVFEVYNRRAADQFEKETLDFDKYEKEMMEFKDREIYSRMFETEARVNT
jgi:tRNA pseudouridine38-40 synthase